MKQKNSSKMSGIEKKHLQYWGTLKCQIISNFKYNNTIDLIFILITDKIYVNV